MSSLNNLSLKDSLIVFLITIPCSILRMWVMTKIWAWFMVPLGLPPVSIPAMFGIGYMWALLNARMSRDEFKFESLRDAITNITAVCVFQPLLILGFGYVVTLFL